MSYQEVSADTVFRAICDGPTCGVGKLFERNDEADIPDGWSRMGIGLGYRMFCSKNCVVAWLTGLVVERRDKTGWQISYTDDWFVE